MNFDPPFDDSKIDQSALKQVQAAVEATEPRPASEFVNPKESTGVQRRAIANLVGIESGIVHCALKVDAKAPKLGDFVAIKTGRSLACAAVHGLKRDPAQNIVEIKAQLVGEIIQHDGRRYFSRGINIQPPMDAPVFLARRRDLELIYHPTRTEHVHIGSLRANDDVPAHLATDDLLGKHFAVIGSTGSGKSCALTVMLGAVLKEHPKAHVLLIDPHNEYHKAFSNVSNRLAVQDLELPFWLMTFEEFSAVIIPNRGPDYEAQYSILKKAVLEAKRGGMNNSIGVGPRREYSVDAPVPFRMADLREAIEELMGKLNKSTTSAPHRYLLERIDNIENDKRFWFLVPPKATNDNMRQILSSLLRIPVDEKPLTIVDISGVPAEVVNVVVAMLSRLIFEFKVWAPRNRTPPVLLVCEEAHRYVPNADQGQEKPAQRAIDQIAREGRKYGVGLGLVSQRPADLSPTSLSQCGTIVTLRLTSERDQEFVRRILPEGSNGMLGQLPTLGTGEAVVVGEAAPLPMQIAFENLPPERQPNSGTPSFAKAWRENIADEGLVDEVILRWRGARR